MPDLKISQLTDQAAPPAASTFVPVVNDILENRRVSLTNIVKAGISGGGVGLSTVASTGAYADLSGKPTQALSAQTDVTTVGVVDGDVLRYSTALWRPYPDTLLTDGGNF